MGLPARSSGFPRRLEAMVLAFLGLRGEPSEHGTLSLGIGEGSPNLYESKVWKPISKDTRSLRPMLAPGCGPLSEQETGWNEVNELIDLTVDLGPRYPRIRFGRFRYHVRKGSLDRIEVTRFSKGGVERG